MANEEVMKTVPRLEDYYISEEIGFLLPDPLVELPEYFEPWNRLNRDLADLIKDHKVRDAVAKLPLLDDSLLCGHKQLRLAYMILSFAGSGYIWQEGDNDLPKVVPRQLAIPWYSVSQRLGLNPSVCQANFLLSNCIHIDRTQPLHMENMKLISKFTEAEGFSWFIRVTSQTELDAVPGIKAIVGAMRAVVQGDTKEVCSHLETIASAIRTMKNTTSRMHEHLPGGFFFNVIRPFLSGWGGKDSKIPDGLIFEGACAEPVSVLGGSAAQSSPIQCFDIALGIDHGAGGQYLNEIRNYMPPAHANFIRALIRAPSIKEYVSSTDDAKLKQLYADCISALREFRSYHIQLVTKYIVVPAREGGNDVVDGLKGTGGTDLMPFLKQIRDSTKNDV